jgi:hypothetical protein
LPSGFVSHDRNGVGQVQAPHRIADRNAQCKVARGLQDGWRQALRLFSKDQSISPLIIGGRIQPRSRFGKEPATLGRQLILKHVPIVDYLPLQMGPIIQPGSAEMFGVNAKAKGPDQPKFRTQRHACPPNIARVLWDFRLVKNNMQLRFVFHEGCIETVNSFNRDPQEPPA